MSTKNVFSNRNNSERVRSDVRKMDVFFFPVYMRNTLAITLTPDYCLHAINAYGRTKHDLRVLWKRAVKQYSIVLHV